MTDGEISKSNIHSRGSNEVSTLDSSTNKNSDDGPSSIHLYAIKGKKIKLQEELRNNKSDINKVDQLGRTPLVYSVLGDQIECVSMLLKMGADVNIADIDERTALHWAAYQGNNHKLVKLLLSKGADKVKRDKEGRTPLHLSISHDNIKVMETLLRSMKEHEINCHDNNKVTPLCLSVFYDCITYTRLLLKFGADPSIMDKESRTVLHWTSQNKHDDILRLLIEYVEKLINFPDCEGRTALHMAIGRSNKKLVDFLLSVQSIDINIKDSMGRTPLHWAAVLGDTAIVSLLLDKGADHKICDGNGVYPLHYAAKPDSHETVLAMLEKEGIEDLADNEHGTALMWAAVKGSDKVLEVLLEKKCSDVNAIDAHLQTALHKCTQAGHLNCVKILIKYGAEVNVYDKKHHIPLFYACASGHGDIVKELLNNGSSKNLDKKDNEGRCPIHFAAMADKTDIIKILLEHNSNVNNQDNDGCTPLHFASFLGFVHCISVLLENGASVNLQDKVGRTALHLACQSGNVDAVKLLVARFNASVNIFAHEEDEELTPLDYAIVGDHQDVAFYLQTEHNADTAYALKENSATKIQATWKGYWFRKVFAPDKHLFLKHEIERKNTFENVLLNCDTEFTSKNVFHKTPSIMCSELGGLFSDKDIDSHSICSQSETKSRSNISSISCKTVSSNSSVFLPLEKSSVDNLNRPKQSSNTLSVASLTKQKQPSRRSSSTNNDIFQETSTTKKIHKNSTNSLNSYSHYHHGHSIISSSSSDMFSTNASTRQNEERNNFFNKSYSRHVSGSKQLMSHQSSSSESSVLFDSRPVKPLVLSQNPIHKNLFEPKNTQYSESKQKISKKKEREPVSKLKIVQPDASLEKPWNNHRNNQKRIFIIRQHTNAAIKIQSAYRNYKNSPLRKIKTKSNFELEECLKDSVRDDIAENATLEDSNRKILVDENLFDPNKEEINECFDESSNEDLDYDDECINEVAALFIQSAWRKYVKRKLLVEHYQRTYKLPECNTDQDLKEKPICLNKKDTASGEESLTQKNISIKQTAKIKNDVINPPISYLEKIYSPDKEKKVADHLRNNTIPLRAALDEPPLSCKSPLRSNSSKQNGKYLKTPVKKASAKGMKVK